MLNDLNIELQGKDKTVIDMISSVNSFKRKLQHLSSKLQRHDLANFKNRKACVQLDGARCQSLTNTFKTLFYWSQLLQSCPPLFGKMLRLIHSRQKLKHCFT